MKREPNDLEVRYENQVVGWLNHFDGSVACKHIVLEIHTSTESDGGFGESVCDSHQFKVVVCRSSHAEDDYLRHSGDWVAKWIAQYTPPYATFHKDPATHNIKYEWQAVKLASFQEYEWIFEHHCFVPANAPIDLETVKTEEKYVAPARKSGKVALAEYAKIIADETKAKAEAEAASYDKEKLFKLWPDKFRTPEVSHWGDYSITADKLADTIKSVSKKINGGWSSAEVESFAYGALFGSDFITPTGSGHTGEVTMPIATPSVPMFINTTQLINTDSVIGKNSS